MRLCSSSLPALLGAQMHALNTTESAASALTCTQDTGHRTVQVLDRAAMCTQPGWQGASQSLLPRRRYDARDVRGRLCGRPGHQPVAVHAERAAADAGLHWRLRRRARPGGRRALPAVRRPTQALIPLHPSCLQKHVRMPSAIFGLYDATLCWALHVLHACMGRTVHPRNVQLTLVCCHATDNVA